MRTLHLLLAVAVVVPGLAAAPDQDIAGEWHGSIEVPNDAPLRLALHIARDSSVGIRATIDSIDEGGMDLPLDMITTGDATMKFEMKNIGGTYQGKMAADGSSITGSWSQDGAVWLLTWHRGEDPGNVSQLFEEHEARRKGQIFTGWFYEGRLSDLWTKLSPVMQQALGAEAKLKEFREQVLEQMGTENKVLEESVKPSGVLQVYRRLAKFGRATGNVEVTLSFDARGAIAGFNICSIER
jgi:hypothetical protein